MKERKYRLTLHKPAIYRIQVPGELDKSWADWDWRMQIEVEDGDPPVTTLTGSVDQAALHSLLRRLYALGLPLISVVCLEASSA
jgi:hypothetical protein